MPRGKQMQPHLFVSSTDGALYDTRQANWSASPPLRATYSRHCHEINTTAELKACLRAGRYTGLGGYPLYFITADGAALSFEAVRQELRQILQAIADNDTRGGWRVVDIDINYEDNELFCDHTGKRIESAYGED